MDCSIISKNPSKPCLQVKINHHRRQLLRNSYTPAGAVTEIPLPLCCKVPRGGPCSPWVLQQRRVLTAAASLAIAVKTCLTVSFGFQPMNVAAAACVSSRFFLRWSAASLCVKTLYSLESRRSVYLTCSLDGVHSQGAKQTSSYWLHRGSQGLQGSHGNVYNQLMRLEVKTCLQL